MNLLVAVLAFILGTYVAESIQTMTPEKMEKLEKEKNETSK